MFGKISASSRITISLVALTVTTLLSAHLLGLIPNERDSVMRGRSSLCESIAIQFSLFAARNDIEGMQTSLQAIAERNLDILSIGIREPEGRLLQSTKDHSELWSPDDSLQSSETRMNVPVFQGNQRWGTVEVAFAPPELASGIAGQVHPLIALTLFFVVIGSVTMGGYLRTVLTQLNPSKVVPQRVRSALDSLAEGLLLLDREGRIVLANQSFSNSIGQSTEALMGRPAHKLPWVTPEESATPSEGTNATDQARTAPPWTLALQDGKTHRGQVMGLKSRNQEDRTYVVSASPICDDQGRQRGAIASFEDISVLEQKKTELSHTLQTLRTSSEKIRQQNVVLERLATRDPLTGCFNRRAFFEQFDAHWNAARRYSQSLSAIMVDIDHFKLINDNHGHSTGDQVLHKVAETLMQTARDVDIVARYGGEEFAILLPNTDILDASVCAERFRKALAAIRFPNLSITASLGVSAVSQQPSSPQELLDQADKCLYVAKRNGRNQVVRFDQVPEGTTVDEKQAHRGTAPAIPTTIPFPAVTALISALAYRDPETAAHSRRVADLCVEVANGLMSMSHAYVLEMAALLHDIGKIGIPDAILLKPNQLSEEEWNMMKVHERIGLEIIRASFASEDLSQIVENYRRQFDGRDENLGPTGNRIPLGARILAIADAYDSMTTAWVYRPARPRKDAFVELRRCAGTQFDPDLVERFIQVISQKRTVSVTGHVTKETALGIGQEMERLAEAVDKQDIEGLKVMAGRLAASAARSGAPEIAAKAIELELSAKSKGDVLGVLQRAGVLIDYCRATQSAYLDREVESRRQQSASSAAAS